MFHLFFRATPNVSEGDLTGKQNRIILERQWEHCKKGQGNYLYIFAFRAEKRLVGRSWKANGSS